MKPQKTAYGTVKNGEKPLYYLRKVAGSPYHGVQVCISRNFREMQYRRTVPGTTIPGTRRTPLT